MKYLRFRIENYRAVTGPLEIDLVKHSLMPIVGINESGKTTILQAIFAFDYYNDELNDSRHLRDTSNLYSRVNKPPTIAAEISLSLNDFTDAIQEITRPGTKLEEVVLNAELQSLRTRAVILPPSLWLSRNLNTGKYSILDSRFSLKNEDSEDQLVRAILKYVPYCLYFDDFRDSVDDRIEIKRSENPDFASWLAIVEQLFKQTENSLSVYDLPSLEERKRKGVIAKVTVVSGFDL